MIIVYSKPHCPYCDKAKYLLKSLGLQYEEKVVTKDLSVDELVSALNENPKLIERPIISNGKSAVIARPLEKLIDFLK